MAGQLKPVYFPLKGSKFGYAKAIVDIDCIDFFLEMGAVKTQAECHEINAQAADTKSDPKPTDKGSDPKPTDKGSKDNG